MLDLLDYVDLFNHDAPLKWSFEGIFMMILLVVEPDYLPDLEVFYFQSCLYPMKYLHPISMYTLPRGGVQRGGFPSAGSGGAIPLARGLGASGPPVGVRG
jgi:hypothetical protein